MSYTQQQCAKCQAKFWSEIPANKWCDACWQKIVKDIQKTACEGCGRSYPGNKVVVYRGKGVLMCDLCQWQLEIGA